MKERYSDQLLGLVVLLANETDGVEGLHSHGPFKTLRGTRLNLQQVLVNSVKKAQPVGEKETRRKSFARQSVKYHSRVDYKLILLTISADGELNTYFFVETFRSSIDELLLNKLVKRDASVPDLYDGVHTSYELLTSMEKLSARLSH